MKEVIIQIGLILLTIGSVFLSRFFVKKEKTKTALQEQIARKYKTQRDESRATARILLDNQEKVKEIQKAGGEIVKEIQNAKTEGDAINIIARLTSDWNAGL